MHPWREPVNGGEGGRGKQMSARSHQLGAGILKQNV